MVKLIVLFELTSGSEMEEKEEKIVRIANYEF
jgi:hypothetical protein